MLSRDMLNRFKVQPLIHKKVSSPTFSEIRNSPTFSEIRNN